MAHSLGLAKKETIFYCFEWFDVLFKIFPKYHTLRRNRNIYIHTWTHTPPHIIRKQYWDCVPRTMISLRIPYSCTKVITWSTHGRHKSAMVMSGWYIPVEYAVWTRHILNLSNNKQTHTYSTHYHIRAQRAYMQPHTYTLLRTHAHGHSHQH